ncbi:MAG: hypothetical protein ABIH20_01450 [Candidatus Diapherotrites archaeon]
MNKGFIISFSTFLVAGFLVLFSIFYVGLVEKQEISILETFSVEKAGFVADDIDYDINTILGTYIDVNRGSSLTTIKILEKLPADTNKLQLIDYSSFVDVNYSGQQNASIELHLDNLIDGKTELVFSNDLQYDYGYSGDSNVLFYKPSSDTQVLTYDINININDSSLIVTPWTWQDITGDINVNLNFVDQNASNEVHYSGKLDSSIENTYNWNYSGIAEDSFYIKIGAFGGNSKALQLTESIGDSSSQAQVSIISTINSPVSLKWYYDADLNYSQGDVNVNRKISERNA